MRLAREFSTTLDVVHPLAAGENVYFLTGWQWFLEVAGFHLDSKKVLHQTSPYDFLRTFLYSHYRATAKSAAQTRHGDRLPSKLCLSAAAKGLKAVWPPLSSQLRRHAEVMCFVIVALKDVIRALNYFIVTQRRRSSKYIVFNLNLPSEWGCCQVRPLLFFITHCFVCFVMLTGGLSRDRVCLSNWSIIW